MSELEPRNQLLAVYLDRDYSKSSSTSETVNEQVDLLSRHVVLGNTLGLVWDEERSIAARYKSSENIQLGAEVFTLLSDAPITNSFKSFIVNSIRQACASKAAVSDEVSTDRLGIDTGKGIYDPLASPTIEAQCLRGRLFTIYRNNIILRDKENGDKTPILRQPARYVAQLEDLCLWLDDYIKTYAIDPYAGLDMEAVLLSAATSSEADADQI